MSKLDDRNIIARRIAQEFEDGDVVNLGIGLPTLVSNYVPDDVKITLQAEVGFLGLGPEPEKGEEDYDLINAGGAPVTSKLGASFFDSSHSFAIIRGGHVNATVLGALQVDEEGNLANWKIPGKLVPGMGGAMDLVVGAKKVIVGMQHTQKGTPKILKRCTLPLTAAKEVNLIVTEMAVMEVTERGLVLKETGPGFTVEDVIAATDANLIIEGEVMSFGDDW